jgi:hypothetical protein
MQHNKINHDFNTCAECQRTAQEAAQLTSMQLYGFEHPHHIINEVSKCSVHAAQTKNAPKG